MLPWNTPERSITGGAIFLGKDYINNLQNTLYLQKFDLRHGPNYWHQYMANVFAPQSESRTMYNAYSAQGSLGEPKEFLIPVFTSIPIYLHLTRLEVRERPITGCVQSRLTKHYCLVLIHLLIHTHWILMHQMLK